MILPKRIWRFLLIFTAIVILLLSSNIVKANDSKLLVQKQSNSVTTLVNKARENYELGKLRDAIPDLEQAVVIFAQQGDKLNQAIVLSNLSSIYQQLGEWQKAEQAIITSLELFDYKPQKEINYFTAPEQKAIASILGIYGHFALEKGQADVALKQWQKAEQIYKQLNQQQGIIQSQINQLYALQSLGLSQQLNLVTTKIEKEIDHLSAPLKVEALKSLGEVLNTIGDLDKSEQMLQESLTLATEEVKGAIFVSLGNTYWAKGNLARDRQNSYNSYDSTPWQCQNDRDDPSKCTQLNLTPKTKSDYQQAQNYYQQAIEQLNNPTHQTLAQISLLNLSIESGELSSAQAVWSNIDLTQLPTNKTNIYAQINLARHLADWRQRAEKSTVAPSWQAIENLLIDTLTSAENLAEAQALAYAYGNLGGYYELISLQTSPPDFELLNKAQQLTEKALVSTQPSKVPSIAYQWQWQLGRIYARQGKQKQAISSYRDAVQTLKQVRSNLIASSADAQFSFRDDVEPVYRQLVKLILTIEGDRPQEPTLADAVQLIDNLQLAELENFLSCDLSAVTNQANTINQFEHTAFIFPIVLENQLHVIYCLPGQSLQYHVNQVSRTQVAQIITALMDGIDRSWSEKIIANSEQIYQWLIQPLESYLESDKDIDNLVFILDGDLRNVPMAVLYDANQQKYLIEKDYALAILPTSQLFDLNEKSNQLNVLAAGISEALEVEDKKFEALKADQELTEVKNLVSAQTLLNSEFTSTNLQQQLRGGNFSVLHLATHGNFSSDPQQNYIVAYNQLLRANDLNALLSLGNQISDNQIDLLILSACETASGDNRATLGLAGLAVRAGAKTTLATLWNVKDEVTTSLVTEFYRQLRAGKTKAQALHQAQKSLMYQENNGNKILNYPIDWSGYVLVGNWQ